MENQYKFSRLYSSDPEWISIGEDIQENSTELKQQGVITGWMSSVLLDGIRICHRTISSAPSYQCQVDTKKPFIEMHFMLNGNTCAYGDLTEQPIQMKKGQQNLISIPLSQGGSFCEECKGTVEKLEIHLTPDFFRHALTAKSPLQGQMTEQLERETLHMADSNHAPITPHMQAVITDILQCNRSGYLKKLYLEAKVLELLMLQVEGFEQNRRVISEINSADRDKLYAVKELIDAQPVADYSLSGLSQYAELNTYTLKAEFKSLFGTTVFDYINEVKMQKAKRWLLEGEKNVAETAYALGYDYPGNFSVAFKRTFGINPSELKS